MNLPVPVDRKKFIGGSDAAAVIGASPWRTPLAVYLRKRGEPVVDDREADPAIQDLLETGREMEPVIVNRLVRLYGVKVVRRSTEAEPIYHTDPEHAFMAAQIDFEWEVTPAIAEQHNLPRELIGTVQNGEAKKVLQFQAKKFGEPGTDQVPTQYVAQVAHGLMVTGRQLTMVAAQRGDSLDLYFVHRTAELEKTITGLRALEVAFWTKNVVAGVPPEPKTLEDLANLFPKDKATVVEATPEIAEAFEQFEGWKEKAKEAEAEVQRLKFVIGKHMVTTIALDREGKPKPTPDAKPGSHVLIWAGKPLLTVALQSRTGVEAEKLRKLHPAAARECSKTSTFYKFTTAKEKK